MSVISIGEVLVDRAVLEARFCCNLDLCYGACCVEGELGAPIDAKEANYLESTVETLRPMLPERWTWCVSCWRLEIARIARKCFERK